MQTAPSVTWAHKTQFSNLRSFEMAELKRCYAFFSCFNIVSTANYGFNWSNRKHHNSRCFFVVQVVTYFFSNIQNRDILPQKAAMDRNLVKKLSILSPLTNYCNSKEAGTLLWTKHDAFFFQFTFLTPRRGWARFSKWVAPFSLGSAFLSITRTVQRCSQWPSSFASNSNPCLLWMTINLNKC